MDNIPFFTLYYMTPWYQLWMFLQLTFINAYLPTYIHILIQYNTIQYIYWYNTYCRCIMYRLFTASLFSQIVVAASELELSAKRERGGRGRGRSARFRSLALASVEKIERLWTVYIMYKETPCARTYNFEKRFHSWIFKISVAVNSSLWDILMWQLFINSYWSCRGNCVLHAGYYF